MDLRCDTIRCEGCMNSRTLYGWDETLLRVCCLPVKKMTECISGTVDYSDKLQSDLQMVFEGAEV